MQNPTFFYKFSIPIYLYDQFLCIYIIHHVMDAKCFPSKVQPIYLPIYQRCGVFVHGRPSQILVWSLSKLFFCSCLVLVKVTCVLH